MSLTKELHLRKAKPEDAQAVSDLIVTVARAQLREEFTEEGWELFLRLISKQTQRGIINDQDFSYWLASYPADENHNEKIVGLLCSKNRYHVFHLFILPEHQRQGVGRRLWRNYLMHIPNNYGIKITVNASDFAVAFYERLGFKINGQREMKNGLIQTPMKFYLSHL